MDRMDLQAAANYYLLRKALGWLESQAEIPAAVLKRVDVLNAEKCGVSGEIVCRVLV